MPGVMVDRSAIDSRPTIPTRHQSLKTTRISPARKLWLCVVLQAVAEQDSKNVLDDDNSARHGYNREHLAATARAYLGTADFEECCELADIDVEVAREVSPECARSALSALMGGKRLPSRKEPIHLPNEVSCAA